MNRILKKLHIEVMAFLLFMVLGLPLIWVGAYFLEVPKDISIHKGILGFFCFYFVFRWMNFCGKLTRNK